MKVCSKAVRLLTSIRSTMRLKNLMYFFLVKDQWERLDYSVVVTSHETVSFSETISGFFRFSYRYTSGNILNFDALSSWHLSYRMKTSFHVAFLNILKLTPKIALPRTRKTSDEFANWGAIYIVVSLIWKVMGKELRSNHMQCLMFEIMVSINVLLFGLWHSRIPKITPNRRQGRRKLKLSPLIMLSKKVYLRLELFNLFGLIVLLEIITYSAAGNSFLPTQNTQTVQVNSAPTCFEKLVVGPSLNLYPYANRDATANFGKKSLKRYDGLECCAKTLGKVGTKRWQPLKAALLINYDPTGPSRLVSTIAEQEGIKTDPIEISEFVSFVKRNKLQMETFFIGPNEYLVSSIHESWFCARCLNTSMQAGEGAIVMQTSAFLLVGLYEGSIGSASRAMVALDQFAAQLGRRNF
ncbi:hypothetical protein Sango_1211700 [Sesamum angolense]|uniref:Profilin n=1 Tax=Sesamum angolense TaxID=2727404 RepID=A0AAE1WX59_9LAMI|nr:hypothetical protein Sango_1211700 [Sesamum angolense]